MAKKKERIEIKEEVVEKVEPIKKEELAKPSSGPVLKKAIIKDRETLLKLQKDGRLVNYDPRTGESTYKEE